MIPTACHGDGYLNKNEIQDIPLIQKFFDKNRYILE